ncbi:unnamed protein product [Nesidiocoris tenuis]|uniref:Uncharacterized protein n=1 Tax=Nesidiocoris tenuis TaxID=355587 RepID=A0A6H5GUX2_9HEMI|nr:unnamed protein product [Nesidiocoris tenuis]
MMVSLDLRAWSPNLETSTPSIEIVPPAASMILNRLNVIDDLPAPVLPTMPICWKNAHEPKNLREHQRRFNTLLPLTLSICNTVKAEKGDVKIRDARNLKLTEKMCIWYPSQYPLLEVLIDP